MARLPEEKNAVFENVVRGWEASYAMLSVSLNESFSLRARGELVRARLQLGVSADLVAMLSGPLLGALKALIDHGQKFGTYPRVDPLDPEFFHGAKAHRAASWSVLLHGVAFGERSRFLQKLRTLCKAIQEIHAEFGEIADVLVEGTSVEPAKRWSELDALHFDLNTCLREMVVILKSFLCVVPSDQLPSLEACLSAPAPPLPAHTRHSPAHVPT